MTNQAITNPTWGASRDAARKARRESLSRDYGILLSIAVLVIALSLSTDTFLTVANLRNLVDQMVVVGILASGCTLCIIAGVFDLSTSAILAVTAITGVYVTQSLGMTTGFVVAVLVGLLLGAVNGVVITGIGVNSFIATLATSIVFRGAAVLLTGGAIVYPLTSQRADFRLLTFSTRPLGLTVACFVLLVVVVTTGLLLSFTVYGQSLYAVGSNSAAAKLAGIPVARVQITVLMISGVCAALAGLVLASRAGSAQASLGTGLELTAIAATVVGGTSINGGEGAIWRGMAGVAILQLLSNGFNLLGWDTTYQQVLTGALILFAVSVDQVLRRSR
jgi:ribose transport system permease protein